MKLRPHKRGLRLQAGTDKAAAQPGPRGPGNLVWRAERPPASLPLPSRLALLASLQQNGFAVPWGPAARSAAPCLRRHLRARRALRRSFGPGWTPASVALGGQPCSSREPRCARRAGLRPPLNTGPWAALWQLGLPISSGSPQGPRM